MVIRIMFVVSLFFGLSCAKKEADTEPEAAQNTETDRFRTWAKDTLAEFLKGRAADTSFFESSSTYGSFRMGALRDTSALFVENNYALRVDPANYQKHEGSVIHSVISLLKEYDELPDTVFDLEFVEYFFYSPSFIEQRAYDYVQEIKALKVGIPDRKTKITYHYNRGSLSSSQEIKDVKPCRDCLSSYIEEYYDFIYSDEVGSVQKKLNNAKRVDVKNGR